MMDLTKITTPFGLLHPETQEALEAHGGPFQTVCSQGWVGIAKPSFHPSTTYRVKPEPPRPREFWVNVYPNGDPVIHLTEKEALQGRLGTSSRTIQVREVIEE